MKTEKLHLVILRRDLRSAGRDASDKNLSNLINFEAGQGFEKLKDLVEGVMNKGCREVIFMAEERLPLKYRRDLLPLWIQKIREVHLDADFHYAGWREMPAGENYEREQR